MLIALASPAFAADRQAEGRPSFERILPEIRRHTPGTFYDAEGPFVGQDGQARYRIKWMTPDGRVIWFDADAHSGRVLGRVPYPANRFGADRYGSDRYGDDRYGADHYDRDRYDDDRYDGERHGNGGNSDRFRNWPGYDRGQGDRIGRWGDRGDWRRGGSDHGYSGRGDSGRGRGRH